MYLYQISGRHEAAPNGSARMEHTGLLAFDGFGNSRNVSIFLVYRMLRMGTCLAMQRGATYTHALSSLTFLFHEKKRMKDE